MCRYYLVEGTDVRPTFWKAQILKAQMLTCGCHRYYLVAYTHIVHGMCTLCRYYLVEDTDIMLWKAQILPCSL